MKRTLAGLSLLVAQVAFAVTAHAAPIRYVASLSGLAEFPPNASPGTGTAEVDFDAVAHTLRVIVAFSGLIGTTTASHIHCCTATPDTTLTAPVATQIPSFTGFPLGVTSGTYDQTFDLTLTSSWRAAFITDHGGTTAGAEAALAAGLASRTAYLNIHTSFAPGGEIRGFLAVPEPSSPALFGAALGLLALTRLRWRRLRSRAR